MNRAPDRELSNKGFSDMTLEGKIIVLTLGVLAILLLIGAVRWAAPRLQDVDLPFLDQPTPTSVVPTSTPRPTATPLPEPTATPTSTVNYPAYWSEGMWQDANDQWWPADDVREEVMGTIEQHYLEIYENVWNLTYDEIYETLSEEDMERFLTGQHMADHRLSRKRYRDTGTLPSERYMIVTERKVTIRDFASNGQSCIVADMYRSAHLLKYDHSTDSWNKVEIPEDGLLDGTQFLGTALYKMEYDPEDGRWKQESLAGWLPRP